MEIKYIVLLINALISGAYIVCGDSDFMKSIIVIGWLAVLGRILNL